MNYGPAVESLNPIGKVRLGAKHTAMLCDQIQAAGSIEYAFIVGVFDDETDQPVLFVASEVNSMADQFGGGSHFLGVFPGDGHENHGDSDDWADPKKFFPAALAIAAERIGVPPPPELRSPVREEQRPANHPWWQFWKR